MKRQLTTYILIITAFVGISPGLSALGRQEKTADQFKEVGEVIKLEIQGMTCGSCAYAVKTALQQVKYVKIVEVDYDTAIATIHLEKNKSIDINNLINAVERIGYKAKLTG